MHQKKALEFFCPMLTIQVEKFYHSNEYLLWNGDISRTPCINLLENLIFEGKNPNLQVVNLNKICQIDGLVGNGVKEASKYRGW